MQFHNKLHLLIPAENLHNLIQNDKPCQRATDYYLQQDLCSICAVNISNNNLLMLVFFHFKTTFIPK